MRIDLEPLPRRHDFIQYMLNTAYVKRMCTLPYSLLYLFINRIKSEIIYNNLFFKRGFFKNKKLCKLNRGKILRKKYNFLTAECQ